MPSTGTPEPGGPEYFELIHFLRDVIRERNVVGFDVVELCPSAVNKAPDFIAAKIIYQLLSYRFASKLISFLSTLSHQKVLCERAASGSL